MTDILSLVFRTFTSQTDGRKELTVAPPSPTTSSTLVVGDAGISRSVLLLAAVTAASELGTRVVFFTHAQIQSLPLCLQKRVPSLSPESLKKIKFSYPRTVEELLQQVASLHEPASTSPSPPSLIVVDGLEGYLRGPGGSGGAPGGLDPGERSRAAHLAALLCDSAAFLTQLLRPSRADPCRVIASFRSVDAASAAEDPALEVLDRYFRARCTLDRAGGYEAAAAGLQEVWHVYLSGIRDREDRPAATQEWKLLISPDGFMEFKVV
ncbi:ATPase SWSAP1 [Clinocottus analis]|uniref:ATPase SWSAP1 n=1 Tax=Clinocottus analis TaxID=304258 RepID=UPI0035C0422F